MENKYYSPEIEDIRVGYECEFQIDKKNNVWRPFTFKKSDLFECAICNGEKVNEKNCELRTPFLTKEQIEGEGWNYVETLNNEGNPLFFKKDKLVLIYWNTTRKTMMYVDDYPREHMLFRGVIPSINEFRTIIKLLNIK